MAEGGLLSGYDLERITATVEHLVAELDAGRIFSAEDLEPWEWHGIVAWRRYWQIYQAVAVARLTAYFRAAFTQKN
ncbi:MAG: hypothetical protein AB1477_06410 [Acidobacteriota bacterium]